MAWLPTVIGVILGLVIALTLILEDQGELPDWHWPAFNGLLLIPALFVATGVHEIGHLVGAMLVGLDTGGMAVGGLVFFKSGNNWAFRFDRRMWIGGYFKPFTRTIDFRPARYAWMVAAGPVASIALTAFCGALSVHYGNILWDWTGTLFWVSLFLVVISLAPFSSGLNKSDGKRLWLLVRYPEQALSLMAILALQTEEAKGLRPREWDPYLVERLLAVDVSAGEYPYCQLMAFYRRLDEGMESTALEHLENALAKSTRTGKAVRHTLFLEASCASANIRKRADQARIWCERACKLRKPESLDVVEAGIAMCEGRYKEAVQNWEAARARVVRQRLDSGLVRFAKEKWGKYEAACRAARGRPSA